MRSKTTWLIGLLMAVFASTAVYAEDSLEAVQKKIEEKWAKVESMTAKMKMNMNMKSPEPIKTDGVIEFLREGGKEKFRMEMQFEQNMQGNTMKVSSTTIYDGDFAYSVTDMMGQKMAVKQKSDVLQGVPGGRAMFERMSKTHDLKVLPDAKVDGKDVAVIEAKIKSPDPGGVGAYRMNFVKDTGVLIKTVGIDEKGEAVMEIAFEDVKVNPKLDPSDSSCPSPECRDRT